MTQAYHKFPSQEICVREPFIPGRRRQKNYAREILTRAACPGFPGIEKKTASPLAWASAIIFWGAIPHWIGLYLAIKEGKTAAACIIAIFAGFWSFVSAGLVFFPEDLPSALFWIKPGMFLSILILQNSYRSKPILLNILFGLAALILLLWLSKIITTLEIIVPWALFALGIWALIVAYRELKIPILPKTD